MQSGRLIIMLLALVSSLAGCADAPLAVTPHAGTHRSLVLPGTPLLRHGDEGGGIAGRSDGRLGGLPPVLGRQFESEVRVVDRVRITNGRPRVTSRFTTRSTTIRRGR